MIEVNAEMTRYTPNRVRSETAPESIVAAVPQNTAWETKKAAT